MDPSCLNVWNGRWIGLVLLFFLLSSVNLLFGQAESLCGGSLGENIFSSGDFGSGQSNIGFIQAPGLIAPGYTFTNQPPPDDGFFTITNFTGWEDTFPGWISIRDNSPDPNGYMMVVNADFQPGIFYQNTITGLCENTTYEFSVDIINMIGPGFTGFSLPRVSFFLDGEKQFSTGSIPQTGQWNTYGFTFSTPPGVTEMALSLRNDAPGGFGNDLALDNISFRACGPSSFINTDQNIFLCEDDNTPQPLTADVPDTFFLQWQISQDEGQSWTDVGGETAQTFFHQEFLVGTYQYRYLSATNAANLQNLKCRYVSDIVTIEVLPLEYTVTDTICAGIPYLFDQQSLTTSGTYFASLVSSKGCDSLVTLNLTVLPDDLDFSFEAEPPACPGDTEGIIEVFPTGSLDNRLQFFLNSEPVPGAWMPGLGEGSYIVEIVDRFGCQAIDSIDLFIGELFSIEVGPDLFLDFGEVSLPVRVSSNRSIGALQWEPEDYLDCSNCEENSIKGVRDITYTIRAQSASGCIAVDSFQVFLENESIRIYVPEAFSPNEDGANDLFGIFGFAETIQEISSFRVFDRWGGLLVDREQLAPNSPEATWDGRARGKLLGPGVYVYVFDLILIDGSPYTLSGSVNLMR